MKPTILVVEDQPSIQELVVINLKHAGFLVVSTNSAGEAESLMHSVLPDLLILDWMLPNRSAETLIKKIRANELSRESPIIMLTARVQEGGKVQGVEVGADDYVIKPFSPKELVTRVRAVLRRRTPQLAVEAIESGSLAINTVTHRVLAGGQPIELGPTEFKLLFFFMMNAERVHSRSQLLDEVWGPNGFVEERTVDVHIRRLRTALAHSGNHERLETVRGVGYRFRGT